MKMQKTKKSGDQVGDEGGCARRIEGGPIRGGGGGGGRVDVYEELKLL